MLSPLFHKDGRPLLNTDFAHYYQRIRSKQKREALLWSLGLVALYLGAGNLAEFNLHTVWVSIPHFFDYSVMRGFNDEYGSWKMICIC